MRPLETPTLASDLRLRALLATLHLASPALPVGGFAYSQGLESAIAEGIVSDAASARRWIDDLLVQVLARFEAPLWLRAFDACAARDFERFAAINAELLAARETAELRAETRQMGASLLRLFPAFELALPVAESRAIAYPAAFAAACWGLGVDREAGLTAHLWSWVENQVLAAVKTLPLGQQAGQAMLLALQASIVRAVQIAVNLPDAQLGSLPVAFALCSARHESLYSRLYRS